jgi:hypothetical protein
MAFTGFVPSGQSARNVAASRLSNGGGSGETTNDNRSSDSLWFLWPALLALSLLGWAASYTIHRNISKEYIGVIVNKGYEENSGYYKHSGNPKYYLILNVDSINKNIRVDVTVPCWGSLNIGDRAAFKLNINELEQYGNGDKHLIK